MKKLKSAALFFSVLLAILFLASPEILPDNYQFQEDLKSSKGKAIIVFNSGGWGNTPLDRATDFSQIVRGIQNTLADLNYDSSVVSYDRTGDDFLEKVMSVKEVLRSFESQSKILARKIEEFLRLNPDKIIIMSGLSNGAAFEESIMEKISQDGKDRVLAIEVGIPFWAKNSDSFHILRLDNQGKDILAAGRAKDLMLSLLQTPFNWFFANLSAKDLSLAKAFEAKGHQYYWPEVKPEITAFLKNNLKQ